MSKKLTKISNNSQKTFKNIKKQSKHIKNFEKS